MKPTKRQLYILQYAEKRLIKGYEQISKSSKRYSGFRFIRSSEMYRPGSERNPSHDEIVSLLTFDWAEVVDDPNNYTEDTKTGQRWGGKRIVATAFGKRMLREAGL